MSYVLCLMSYVLCLTVLCLTVLCLTVLSPISPKEEMVRGTGLEPVTPTVSRWCSTTELTALAVACGREDKLK